MACWRCLICFVFVALSLKSLLSHINLAHSRSPDFRVICGIEGCAAEYRVYKSFYSHIRRSHGRYFESGLPPTEWITTAEPSRFGCEHFDIPVFSGAVSQTRNMQRTSSEANACSQMSQVRCNASCMIKQTVHSYLALSYYRMIMIYN